MARQIPERIYQLIKTRYWVGHRELTPAEEEEIFDFLCRKESATCRRDTYLESKNSKNGYIPKEKRWELYANAQKIRDERG